MLWSLRRKICYRHIFSTVLLRAQHQSTFTKFQEWYRAMWSIKEPAPPYTHICQIGDPTLRLRAEEVNLKDIHSNHMKNILLRMRNVMKHYKSVGISAPQIGIPLRIIMVEIPDYVVQHFGPEVCKTRGMNPTPFKVFVNPTMEVKDHQVTLFPESCESLKGISALVPRFQCVRLQGYEYDGSLTEWEASGWAARIVQHEMDHLNGIMYTDKMDCKSLEVRNWKIINIRKGDVCLTYKH